MPFIPLISPGEGLAVGICMFTFCSGEARGFGEAAGICIPGIFISLFSGVGEGEGPAGREFIPGMFICSD